MKILIIEDEYALADALAEILKKENFMVDIITDGVQGEDDYITKPFHMRELVARVKVILKRNNDIDDMNILEYGDIKLNLDSCVLSCNTNSIEITGKELELLELLMLNKNQVVDRENLANKIWGYDSEAEYNNVEVYITFIRRKLKILNSNVKIKAVRGIGYKLEVEND